jgi:protein SCO1/2
MYKFIKLFFIYVILIASENAAFSQQTNAKLGIEDKPGAQLPMDLTFTDSKGEMTDLKNLIKKPTVLAFVYYRCPGICSPLLSAMGETMENIDMVPGVDFQAMTISFNHTEDAELAAGKKRNYVDAMKKPFPKEAWTWLVADSLTISKITDAAGFYFEADGKGDFIHSGALIILTPEGKISRYLYGTEFLPADLQLALEEAAEGRSNPTITRYLAWCFGNFDSESDKYVLDVKKIFGSVIFISIGIFFSVLIVKGRKKKNKKERS